MTRDHLTDSGGDWEPDDSPAPAEHGRQKSPRGTSRGGIILMASTALAVILASGLGVGASLGWFAAAPSESLATESSSTPVDAGDEPVIPTTPLALPPAVPGVVGTEAESEKSATDAVNALLEATTEITQRADGNTTGIDSIATGFVAGELESLALERSQMGYTQTGAAKIDSVTTRDIDLAATPPSLTLAVCIDTSGIDVLDANGTSLKDRLYEPGVPTLHLYGAQFVDGLWKIATHEIPDNASCS